MKILFVMLISSSLLIGAQAQETNSLLTLDKTIPLPAVEGRIDHMAVDVAGQRLFMAALGNDTVEVLDLKNGKQIQSLTGFAEPQGIVYVPEFDRLFIANGADGTCRILDGHSFQTISTVELGDDADNVRYDETAKKVYVGYGGGALAAMDAKTGAKVADIPLAAHPESFRFEANGAYIFVNVPKAGHIAVVDREKGSVVETWPLTEAKSNFPIFLDEGNHRLFVGCRSPAKVLIYDSSASNHLIASVPIASDTDDLFYDARNKLLYVSCGGGSIVVIKQNDADHYQQLATVPTARGARTSLFIPEMKLLCVAVPHRGSQTAEIRVYKTR
jgi:hypothetical protein